MLKLYHNHVNRTAYLFPLYFILPVKITFCIKFYTYKIVHSTKKISQTTTISINSRVLETDFNK